MRTELADFRHDDDGFRSYYLQYRPRSKSCPFYLEFRKMRKRLGRAMVSQALLCVLLTAAACDKSKNSTPAQPGPNMGGPGGPPSPIGAIMTKLAKGPQSLNETIGRELKSDPPTWDAIQSQTKEYAQVAAKLSQFDPPKGSKESWTKLTASYSESAAALEKAAAAKNKDAAVKAHATLNQSCKGCHQEHRPERGGMRGPGGPPRPPQP
jgi:hypothetical protein